MAFKSFFLFFRNIKYVVGNTKFHGMELMSKDYGFLIYFSMVNLLILDLFFHFQYRFKNEWKILNL